MVAADGDFNFVDENPIAFNAGNFGFVDDKRAVHPQESRSGQQFFEARIG